MLSVYAPVTDAQQTADCRNEGVLGPVIELSLLGKHKMHLVACRESSPARGVLRVYDAKEQRIDKLAVGPVDGCAHS